MGIPTDTTAETINRPDNGVAAAALLKELHQFDPVERPLHYNIHPSGVECIEITRHFNFCIGNAIKYLWRAEHKGEYIQDLKKARFYIDQEIDRVEAREAMEKPCS